MFDLVSVDREHRTTPEFGEGAQQVGLRAGGSDAVAAGQLSVEFAQDRLPTLGVKRVEERRSSELPVMKFGDLLEKVPTADDLTQNSQHAEMHEGGIGDDAFMSDIPHIVGEYLHGGVEQLVEDERIALSRMSVRGTGGRERSHPISVSEHGY